MCFRRCTHSHLCHHAAEHRPARSDHGAQDDLHRVHREPVGTQRRRELPPGRAQGTLPEHQGLSARVGCVSTYNYTFTLLTILSNLYYRSLTEHCVSYTIRLRRMKLNNVCSLHRLDEAVFNKVLIFRGFLEGAKWSKDFIFHF